MKNLFSHKEDDEHLESDSEGEAMYQFLTQDFDPGYAPDIVTIFEFTPEKIHYSDIGNPLEHLLEAFDDALGVPDEPTEPTAEMIDAERVFREAVLSKCKVWVHRIVSQRDINWREWCAENESELLKEIDESR